MPSAAFAYTPKGVLDPTERERFYKLQMLMDWELTEALYAIATRKGVPLKTLVIAYLKCLAVSAPEGHALKMNAVEHGVTLAP